MDVLIKQVQIKRLLLDNIYIDAFYNNLYIDIMYRRKVPFQTLKDSMKSMLKLSNEKNHYTTKEKIPIELKLI